MAEVTVVGDDALSLELRRGVHAVPTPLVLLTDPSRLEEVAAGAPAEALIAVTSLSSGGTALARSLGLDRPVATFGAIVPLGEATLTEISLPPGLDERGEARWEETLGAALGPVRQVEAGPGLVAARIIATLANEAAHLLGEGGARAEDIDLAMRQGVHYPRGPLLWADLIGLDAVERCLLALGRALGKAAYRPAPVLARLVAEGKTGKLAGEGFFVHQTTEGVSS